MSVLMSIEWWNKERQPLIDFRNTAKNLSNFVSLPWKLHNLYCHNPQHPRYLQHCQHDTTNIKIEDQSNRYTYWRHLRGTYYISKINYLIYFLDLGSRESAEKERIHGLPGEKDASYKRWARGLQEKIRHSRKPERLLEVTAATSANTSGKLSLYQSKRFGKQNVREFN